MLQIWSQKQPDATVKDLLGELKDWGEEGYVSTAVWKRLHNCIASDILPTFSEQSELRQRASGFISDTSVSASKYKYKYKYKYFNRGELNIHYVYVKKLC